MSVIRLERPKSDNGRVTAGIPSLDSSARLSRAHQEAQLAYQRAIRADEKQRREAAVAPDGKRDVTNFEAQKGIVLTGAELIRRLKALNPSFWFEKSPCHADVLGIYIMDNGEKRFLCGMPADYATEFDVREYEEEEVPNDDHVGFKKQKVCTGTRRGWRTVLFKLMDAKLITKAACDRMFGSPSHDSMYWQKATT